MLPLRVPTVHASQTSMWCHMMQWYHARAGVDVSSRHGLPTCYAWNHVVLAPLFFVPNFLMPLLPSPNSMTWSFSTYWKAHRQLGLRLHQACGTKHPTNHPTNRVLPTLGDLAPP